MDATDRLHQTMEQAAGSLRMFFDPALAAELTAEFLAAEQRADYAEMRKVATRTAYELAWRMDADCEQTSEARVS